MESRCVRSHDLGSDELGLSPKPTDQSRKAWYAYYRQVRFARWLGFVKVDGDLIRSYRSVGISN